MKIYSLKTNINNSDVILLSLIDPETEKNIPLNQKCIVGKLIDNNLPPVPGNITYNKAFIDHFHKTILFFSGYSDQVIQLSENQNKGFVYVVDRRNPETPKPKPQDIIGSFEVANGTIVSGSYAPNSNYLPISEDGAFVLQPELEALLYKTAI